MSEQAPSDSRLDQLIVGIFEDVYQSGSEKEVKIVDDSEVIEGTQANGCRIDLARPTLGIEDEIEGSRLFMATVEYPTLGGEAPPVEDIERRYVVGSNYRGKVLVAAEIEIRDGLVATFKVGAGETADLYAIVEQSDFS